MGTSGVAGENGDISLIAYAGFEWKAAPNVRGGTYALATVAASDGVLKLRANLTID